MTMFEASIPRGFLGEHERAVIEQLGCRDLLFEKITYADGGLSGAFLSAYSASRIQFSRGTRRFSTSVVNTPWDDAYTSFYQWSHWAVYLRLSCAVDCRLVLHAPVKV